MGDDTTALSRIAQHAIRPFASVLVLECTAQNANEEIAGLAAKLRTLKLKPRAGRTVRVIAQGFNRSVALEEPQEGGGEETILDGFVTEVRAAPPWADKDSNYQDVRHDLTVILARPRLVAIYCDAGLAGAIQSWLDRAPRPPYERLDPEILHATLLTGEAKSLWLRGTHARRSTKADAKSLTGVRLQDALDPFDDSTFAMGSAKAELIADPDLTALTGIVGTTPRKSTVWLRSTTDFTDFVELVSALLDTLAKSISTGNRLERPYEWLASETRDLSAVSGPFDISVLARSDLGPTEAWSEQEVDAVTILERANLSARPASPDVASPHFLLDAGYDGRVGGVLRGQVTQEGGRVKVAIGYEGTPTDATLLKPVMQALRLNSLFTVYYESGHAISDGRIWKSQLGGTRFPNWSWQDFSGFDVSLEKPHAAGAAAIHSAISTEGDLSLFAWVVATFGGDAWLTCDDAANEVADFVAIDTEGLLSLIHVKGASTNNPARRASVGDYEVVTAQATKNLAYLSGPRLIERLERPLTFQPACWIDRERVPDRDDLLDVLKHRGVSAESRVIIVQPQLRQSIHEAGTLGIGPRIDQLRVQLLDTLLNSCRGATTGLGADLVVVGSR